MPDSAITPFDDAQSPVELSLASNIERLRIAQGRSRAWIAEQVGVTQQTVFKWERMQTRLFAEHLLELSRVFGVSVDDLFSVAAIERLEAGRLTTATEFIDRASAIAIPALLEALSAATRLIAQGNSERR